MNEQDKPLPKAIHTKEMLEQIEQLLDAIHAFTTYLRALQFIDK